jgi:hypothetical protein
MHCKAELDTVGNTIALLVRKAEEYHARMVAHAPPEDPDALKNAKDEVEHARALEKAVSDCSTHFAKKEEAAIAKAKADAEKAALAEKKEHAAEVKAEHKAEHGHGHK